MSTITEPTTTGTSVWQLGRHPVRLFSVDARGTSPPPKPVLVAAPTDGGEFRVLVLLHGYLLYNNFYSQLMQHVASHGFIVVAPQLYKLAGPDCSDEIKSTAALIDWLPTVLPSLLPSTVRPNLASLALAGHSRGGKVAFALALAQARTATTTSPIPISALISIDPVDGMDKGKQTNPPVLSYAPQCFDLGGAAAMVIGCGLSEIKKNPLFPPCAPSGVNHRDFFNECQSPACYVVAEDYGHLDMLDDDTPGIRGRVTYCLCKSGASRGTMRLFVGGAVVAFMKAYLEGDDKDLMELKKSPESAPVSLSVVQFR